MTRSAACSKVSSRTTATTRFLSGGATTTFLQDGDDLVAEYNGATMLRRHVHWPGADLPMVTYQGEGLGTIRQFLADHQGSIVALADASGAATAINTYDEYGIPGAGNDGTFQYTGQIWLPELGMYHYKARIYSPTLGRFMQTDPVGYQGGNNLYGYAGNDPVNAVDPTGTTDIDLINQFDPSGLNYVGHHFDMPGTVTVLTHANPSGIGFRSGPSETHGFVRVPQADLVRLINGRSLTQPVALFGCRLGGAAYARELSRALGGRAVLASAGYVRPQISRDGTITMTAHDERGAPESFQVFGGRGWESFGINVPDGFQVRSISSNDHTGRFSVTMIGQDPGSRIRQARVQEGRLPKENNEKFKH